MWVKMWSKTTVSKIVHLPLGMPQHIILSYCSSFGDIFSTHSISQNLQNSMDKLRSLIVGLD